MGKILVADVNGIDRSAHLVGRIADKEVDVWLTIGQSLNIDTITIEVD